MVGREVVDEKFGLFKPKEQVISVVKVGRSQRVHVTAENDAQAETVWD
jgi:hypothetical protein